MSSNPYASVNRKKVRDLVVLDQNNIDDQSD